MEELRLQNTTREAHRQQSGTVGLKDIEQQAGDVCDAVAVFPEVSVSLCRIEALQQPQQDWKQHFYEAQHTIRHTVSSQRLLDREQEGHVDRKVGGKLNISSCRGRRGFLCFNWLLTKLYGIIYFFLL